MSQTDDSKPKFTLFGTNLERIPCFKRTLTVGLWSGIAVGLGSFLLTSRVKRSTDAAVYSFVGVSLAFWGYCRYNWSKEMMETQRLNSAYHDVVISQGVQKVQDSKT